MPPAVATRSAFRRLFCVIAQRDNLGPLFRGLKLAQITLSRPRAAWANARRQPAIRGDCRRDFPLQIQGVQRASR